MIDQSDIPSCIGCGKSGYYGACPECSQPDHPAEEVNQNAPTDSHNRYNYTGGI